MELLCLHVTGRTGALVLLEALQPLPAGVGGCCCADVPAGGGWAWRSLPEGMWRGGLTGSGRAATPGSTGLSRLAPAHMQQSRGIAALVFRCRLSNLAYDSYNI